LMAQGRLVMGGRIYILEILGEGILLPIPFIFSI